jgi:adenylate kinase
MAEYQLSSADFAARENLRAVFSAALRDLLVELPSDPLSFLKDRFAAAHGKSGPLRIILAGAPASGKGTQAARIREEFGVVHISTGDILRAALKARTPLGLEAEAYMTSGRLVPDRLVVDLVCERLMQPDCRKQGWLLDGFPRTASQAVAIKRRGLLPSHFIYLVVPDEILLERITDRRTDPVTGTIYHLKFNPPPNDPEILARLQHRADDTLESASVRLQQFHRNNKAVHEQWECIAHCHDVFGARNADAVWAELDAILMKHRSVTEPTGSITRAVVMTTIPSAAHIAHGYVVPGSNGALSVPLAGTISASVDAFEEWSQQLIPAQSRPASPSAPAVQARYRAHSGAPRHEVVVHGAVEVSRRLQHTSTLAHEVSNPPLTPETIIAQRLARDDANSKGWVLAATAPETRTATYQPLFPHSLEQLRSLEAAVAHFATAPGQVPVCHSFSHVVIILPKRDEYAPGISGEEQTASERAAFDIHTAYGPRCTIVRLSRADVEFGDWCGVLPRRIREAVVGALME